MSTYMIILAPSNNKMIILAFFDNKMLNNLSFKEHKFIYNLIIL